MNLLHLLIILIIVLLIAGLLPGTPWMTGRGYNWGYGPSGIFGVILIVLIILLLLGRL